MLFSSFALFRLFPLPFSFALGRVFFLGKDFHFAISSNCESAGGRKLDACLVVSFFSRAF